MHGNISQKSPFQTSGLLPLADSCSSDVSSNTLCVHLQGLYSTQACTDNNTINTFQQALLFENFAGQQRKELLREWLFLAQQPLCIPTSTHALALTSSNQTQPVTT